MSTTFDEAVYAAVRKIPKGRVAGYGQIAVLSGYPGAARAVGNALHRNPYFGDVPCHRVVKSTGVLPSDFAFGGREVQRDMLRQEGVVISEFTVDMKKYGL